MPEVHSEENPKATASQGHASAGEKEKTLESPSAPPAHTKGTSSVAVISPTHRNPAPIPTTKAEPISQPPHHPTHSTSSPPTTTEHHDSHTFIHGTSPSASHVIPTVKPSSAGPETRKSSPAASSATRTTAKSEPSRSSDERITTTALSTTQPRSGTTLKRIPTTTPRFTTSRTTLTHSTETQSATDTKHGSTFINTITTSEAPASTKKGNPLDPCFLPLVNHLLCPQKTTTTSLKTSAISTSHPVITVHKTTAPNQKPASTQTRIVTEHTIPATSEVSATKSAHETPSPTRKPGLCSLPIVNFLCPPNAATRSKETSATTTATHHVSGSTLTHSTTDHTTTFTHPTSKPNSTFVHQTVTTLKQTTTSLKSTTKSSKATSSIVTTNSILQTGRPTNKPEQPVTTTRATTKAAPISTVQSQKSSATTNRNHSDAPPNHPSITEQRTTTDSKNTATLQVPGQHSITQGHKTSSSVPAETMTATTSAIAVSPTPHIRLVTTTARSSGIANATGSESTATDFVATASNGSPHVASTASSFPASLSSTDSGLPVEIPAPGGLYSTHVSSPTSSINHMVPHRSDRSPHSSSGPTGLSPGAIVAISVSAAVVCLAAIGALLVFFLCRRRRRRMSKTLDPGHSRSPSHGSVAYLPVYSAVPIPEYQNSTHTLPVLPKTEPTPRHDPRALSMYAYTAQVEKAPADAMTSYNAVYNTSNNRASVLTHSKSISTTGTLYETVPIQSHAQGDYLHEPQDSKRVASLTASIGSSNVHYGVAV